MTSLLYLNFLLTTKFSSHHNFCLNLEVIIYLALSMFYKISFSSMPNGLTKPWYLYINIAWGVVVFWLDFKAILGSLSFLMLFILCLYIRYLVIAMLWMRERPTSMRIIGEGVFLLTLRLKVINCFEICSIFLQVSLEILNPHTSQWSKITWMTRVSKRNLLLSHTTRLTDLQLFLRSKWAFYPPLILFSMPQL